MRQTMSDVGLPRPMFALFIRLCAAASIATMAMLVKLAGERGVHLVEILFWRQALTLPMIIGYMVIAGRLALIRTERLGGHAKRTIYGMLGMVLNFAAVILLPLAEATTLNFTAPIFAVLLSILLLRESVGIYRWGAVLTGFLGILVIAQPGGGHIPPFGALIALGGAFMIALVSIQLQELGRTEQPLTVVFWFAALSTPVLAIGLPFFFVPHDTTTWLVLLGTGIFGGIGQFFLTASLRYGAVASVIVMDYSALVWATLYGWMVWDRLPPTQTWLGAPIVVGAGLLIAWREHRLARARKTGLTQA